MSLPYATLLAYSLPTVYRHYAPGAWATDEGQDPCLHLRVDSWLVGSSEEVATG